MGGVLELNSIGLKTKMHIFSKNLPSHSTCPTKVPEDGRAFQRLATCCAVGLIYLLVNVQEQLWKKCVIINWLHKSEEIFAIETDGSRSTRQ